METQELIAVLESKIAASEKKIERLEHMAEDPEIWAESGYYLQNSIDAETSYCNVLYNKLHKLQENA